MSKNCVTLMLTIIFVSMFVLSNINLVDGCRPMMKKIMKNPGLHYKAFGTISRSLSSTERPDLMKRLEFSKINLSNRGAVQSNLLKQMRAITTTRKPTDGNTTSLRIRKKLRVHKNANNSNAKNVGENV